MTISGKILVSQFNELQARVSRLLGVGTSDYGYGQNVQSSPILPHSIMQTSQWNLLRSDLITLRTHQIGQFVSPIGLVGKTSRIQNEDIEAYIALADLIETNRIAAPHATQATRENITTGTRVAEWNNTITHNVVLQFSSADAMRWYFNAGSTIEITAARELGESTEKNTAWSLMLSSMGVISVGRNTTTNTGNGTASTVGYSGLTNTDDTLLYTTSSTTTGYTENTYSIRGRIGPDLSSIVFKVQFSDASTSGSDVNVSGSLTSIFKTLRSTGAVNTPRPSSTSDMQGGDAVVQPIPAEPKPTYSISKSSTSIGEGLQGIEYTVNTTNVLNNTKLYWVVYGSNIDKDDFTDGLLSDSFTIKTEGSSVNGIGKFTRYAAADTTTEGDELYFVDIHTGSESGPIVASTSPLAPDKILDLSQTAAPVIVPKYFFTSQSSIALLEGTEITYYIGTTNVLANTTAYWTTLGPDTITKDDFKDGRLSGTVTIDLNGEGVIKRFALNDSTAEVEAFQIQIRTVNATGPVQATSDITQILDVTDTPAEIPVTITATSLLVNETSTAGVQFEVKTPKKYYNQTLYWSTSGSVNADDFSDLTTIGLVKINAYGLGYITRRGNLNQNITEGNETFQIVIHEGSSTNPESLVSSEVVTLKEIVDFTVTASAITTPEGDGSSGVDGLGSSGGTLFTIKTPWYPNKRLYWTIEAVSGNVTKEDFYKSEITGYVDVVNNIGYVRIITSPDTTTEGTEQYRLAFRESSDLTDPTNLVKVRSPAVSINESVLPTIEPDLPIMEEGKTAGIRFNVSTPWYPDNTVIFWRVIPDTGNILTVDDFDAVRSKMDSTMSGQFTVSAANGYRGIIDLYAASDAITEGTVRFHVSVRTGSTSGPQLVQSTSVAIKETVPYKITIDKNKIIEGRPGVTLTVSTPFESIGKTLSYFIQPITGNITNNDFTNTFTGTLTGNVTTINSQAKGTIILNPAQNDGVEGDETFKVGIRDTTGVQVGELSELITLSEIIPFTIEKSTSVIGEGSSVKFTVYSPKRDDKTPIYWKIFGDQGNIQDADFIGVTSLKDSVQLKNNQADIIIASNPDKSTNEGAEAFHIVIWEGTWDNGVPAAVSGVVTISDTSIADPIPEPTPPTYTVTSPSALYYEGATITYIVSTTNVAAGTRLYWTLWYTGGITSDDFSSGVDSTNGILSGYTDVTISSGVNGSASISFVSNADSSAEGVESFLLELRTGSKYGPIVTTCETLTMISDEPAYRVNAAPQQIYKGDTVSFTILTPDSANTHTLKYTIVPDSAGLTSANFTIGSFNGTTDTVSNNKVTLNLITNLQADKQIGTQKFHIMLADESDTPLTIAGINPVITILEPNTYGLLANKSTISESETVRFTLTTPYNPNPSVYKYTIKGLQGNIVSTDFDSGLTGTFTVTYSNGVCTGHTDITASSDGFTEGTEQFYLEITNANDEMIVFNTVVGVYITESISYLVSASRTQISEGLSTDITIYTPKDDAGHDLYWKIVPASASDKITEEDFKDTPMSGTVPIKLVTSNGDADFGKCRGKFTITTNPDGKTEGTENFKIEFRKTETGQLLPGLTLPSFQITEVVGYTLTPTALTVFEGDVAEFIVTTPASAPAKMYWRVISVNSTNVNSTDLTMEGEVSIDQTTFTGSIKITTSTDSSTETADEFYVNLYSDAARTALVTLATPCPNVKILDRLPYTIVPTLTTVTEGTAIKVNVTAPAGTLENMLQWRVNSTSITSTSGDLDKFSGEVAIDAITKAGSFTITTIKKSSIDPNKKFTLILSKLVNGTALQESVEVTITDSAGYSIEVSPTSRKIKEGDLNNSNDLPNAAVFTISTPTTAPSTLYWEIAGGSGITYSDFIGLTSTTGLKGQMTVTNYQAVQALFAYADGVSDTGESFFLKVYEDAARTKLITFNPPCPTVNIDSLSVNMAFSITPIIPTGGYDICGDDEIAFTIAVSHAESGSVQDVYWYYDFSNSDFAESRLVVGSPVSGTAKIPVGSDGTGSVVVKTKSIISSQLS